MKKLFTLILLFIIASLCGCSNGAPAGRAETASPEKNTDIVAMVNDDIILKDEVYTVADDYFNTTGFSSADYTDSELLKLYEGILDNLILSMIEEQKAVELGYDLLSDEDAALAESYLKDEIGDRYEYFYGIVGEEYAGKVDETTLHQLADEAVNAYIAETGETDEYLLRHFIMNIAIENMFVDVTKELEISDAELEVGYEERVSQDKAAYTETPGYFASDKTTNMLYYNLPGYRFVKHILVSDEEKANKILALAEKTDFDSLITEYTEDIGSEEFEKGYAVCEDCELYDESFVDAAMALISIGDISPVIEGEDGYHIIKYVSDIAEGPVPVNEVKSELEYELLSNKQQEYYDTLLNEWKNAAEIKIFLEIFGL